MKSAESDRNVIQRNATQRKRPAVDGVTYRPGVYKLLMVRMSERTDESVKVRV